MTSVEQAKAKILEAMYKSVDRMNFHIVEGNDGSIASEQQLQVNLRKNFEDLSKNQEN